MQLRAARHPWLLPIGLATQILELTKKGRDTVARRWFHGKKCVTFIYTFLKAFDGEEISES